MVTTRSGTDTAFSKRSTSVVLNMPFPVSSGMLGHPHSTTGDAGTDGAVPVLDVEGVTVVTPPSVVGAPIADEATSVAATAVEAAGLDKPDELVPTQNITNGAPRYHECYRCRGVWSRQLRKWKLNEPSRGGHFSS
jgi:hypothetical protein